MQEIICAFCKSKQPRREENRFCIRCGKNLERKEVFLSCCQRWYLDMDYCRTCPYCGKETGMLPPELEEEYRKKQDQKNKEEQKRIQEALHPPQLKSATIRTRLTGCKYQGSSKDMLWALYRDQVRNDLIIGDVLKELEKHIDNRAVVLSDSSEHLEIIHRLQSLKEKKVEVVLDGSSDEKLSDVSGNLGSHFIILITPSELMKLELRYVNRLFLASVFDLTEPLIKKIGRLLQSQKALVIIDYLDQDKAGYFNALYQGRAKLYKKHGAMLEKLEG